MTTKARDDAANGAHGRGNPARAPPAEKVQRVFEERDRLMLRGIGLEDVLFPRCVPGAGEGVKGIPIWSSSPAAPGMFGSATGDSKDSITGLSLRVACHCAGKKRGG